jgi:glucosamine-6-phosphate deaminase
MRITITSNEQEFDQTAAWRIIAQIMQKPDSVIGLSTGQTTIGMHRIVAGIHARDPFDVSRVTFFNVDEVTNLARKEAVSCFTVIQTQLTSPLGIPEQNFVMPPSESADFAAEIKLFEQRLAERGGADLQILGIGGNGHIGMNEPGTPFESETWVTKLYPEFEAMVRREAKVPDHIVLEGLTRGIKNIMQTRKIILVAKGAHKAEIIEKAILGPVTTDIPASVLQLHPNCEILLDAAAGAKIAGRVKGRG